jgi:C4-dicarboxylate-specific signal transduction histidine kinase
MSYVEPGAQDLPLTMLHSALRARTHAPIGIDQGLRPAPFARDPYLAAHPRCAAILVPMIRRGQLVGMLYLENRMASCGFSGAQARILSLVAAQAAVSLHTAQLYADLVDENRERRRAEQALRESRATLLLGERINQSGSWTWEVEHGVVNCSDELCRIFDLNPETPHVEFGMLMRRVHAADRTRVARTLRHAVAAHRPVRFEHRMKGRDGMLRYLSVAGQPLEGTRGAVYVGTAGDITRRKTDEEARRRVQAELARGARTAMAGQLIQAIAHEVNQPLMAISANAGAALRWLRREPDRVGRLEAALRDVVGQSQRAGRIIQTLQALADRRPQFAPVDLHALIRQILSVARSELERQEVTLELDLGGPPERIEGDAVQLRQVLANLVQNALEAMRGAPCGERVLRLAVRRIPQRLVEVRVEDSGAGVAGLGFEAMFEPFTSTRPGAMGMGLPICRSIVEAHGGRIEARSRTPSGCSIIFTLPEQADTRDGPPLV